MSSVVMQDLAPSFERTRKLGSAVSRSDSVLNRRPEWVSSVENTSGLNEQMHPSMRAEFGESAPCPSRNVCGSYGARRRAISNPHNVSSSGLGASTTRNFDDMLNNSNSIVRHTESQSWLSELTPHLDRLRMDFCTHCQELAATVTAEFERHTRRQAHKHQLTMEQVVPDMVTDLSAKLVPHFQDVLQAQEERTLQAALQQWHAKGAELAKTWSQKASDVVSIQGQQQCNEILQAIFTDAETRHTQLQKSLQRDVFSHEINSIVEIVRLEFETLSAKCAAGIQATSNEELLQSALKGVERIIHSTSDVLRSDVERVVHDELHQHREHSTRQLDSAVGDFMRQHVRLFEQISQEVGHVVKGVGQIVTSRDDTEVSAVLSEMKRCVKDMFGEQGKNWSRQLEAMVSDAESRHTRREEILHAEVDVLIKREVERHIERLTEQLHQESQARHGNFCEIKGLLVDSNHCASDALHHVMRCDKRHCQILQSVQDVDARMKVLEERQCDQGHRHDEILTILHQFISQADSNEKAEEARHSEIRQEISALGTRIGSQDAAICSAKSQQEHDVHAAAVVTPSAATHADTPQAIKSTLVGGNEIILEAIRKLERSETTLGIESSDSMSEDAEDSEAVLEAICKLESAVSALDARAGTHTDMLMALQRAEFAIAEDVRKIVSTVAAIDARTEVHTDMFESAQKIVFKSNEVFLETLRKLEDTSDSTESCRNGKLRVSSQESQTASLDKR